ncbi:hypothetical protein NDU88_012015 [Pleurodeles waltl]|uniref:Uncharacterized protein n=1 Tax=Pleurodeles waltl TaxID=8319 RepID=A0AAV7S8I2_PLEWA|nr:hypothetical protein NDU88_012015 [Pleurodeles waltl]
METPAADPLPGQSGEDGLPLELAIRCIFLGLKQSLTALYTIVNGYDRFKEKVDKHNVSIEQLECRA